MAVARGFKTPATTPFSIIRATVKISWNGRLWFVQSCSYYTSCEQYDHGSDMPHGYIPSKEPPEGPSLGRGWGFFLGIFVFFGIFFGCMFSR